MVIGGNARAVDLNVIKEKKFANMGVSGADEAIRLRKKALSVRER